MSMESSLSLLVLFSRLKRMPLKMYFDNYILNNHFQQYNHLHFYKYITYHIVEDSLHAGCKYGFAMFNDQSCGSVCNILVGLYGVLLAASNTFIDCSYHVAMFSTWQ